MFPCSVVHRAKITVMALQGEPFVRLFSEMAVASCRRAMGIDGVAAMSGSPINRSEDRNKTLSEGRLS